MVMRWWLRLCWWWCEFLLWWGLGLNLCFKNVNVMMMMIDDGEILMYFFVSHCIVMAIGNMSEPSRECCPGTQDLCFICICVCIFLHLHLYFFIFHRNDGRDMQYPRSDCCSGKRDLHLLLYLYLCAHFYLYLYFFVFHRNDRQGYAVAKPWLLPRGLGRRRSPPSSLQGDTGQEKLSAVITCHLMSSHIHVIIFRSHIYNSYVILSSIILHNINLSISQSCY